MLQTEDRRKQIAYSDEDSSQGGLPWKEKKDSEPTMCHVSLDPALIPEGFQYRKTQGTLDLWQKKEDGRKEMISILLSPLAHVQPEEVLPHIVRDMLAGSNPKSWTEAIRPKRFNGPSTYRSTTLKLESYIEDRGSSELASSITMMTTCHFEGTPHIFLLSTSIAAVDNLELDLQQEARYMAPIHDSFEAHLLK